MNHNQVKIMVFQTFMVAHYFLKGAKCLPNTLCIEGRTYLRTSSNRFWYQATAMLKCE